MSMQKNKRVTVLFTCKVNNYHHLAIKNVYLYRRLLMFTLLKVGFLKTD